MRCVHEPRLGIRAGRILLQRTLLPAAATARCSHDDSVEREGLLFPLALTPLILNDAHFPRCSLGAVLLPLPSTAPTAPPTARYCAYCSYLARTATTITEFVTSSLPHGRDDPDAAHACHAVTATPLLAAAAAPLVLLLLPLLTSANHNRIRHHGLRLCPRRHGSTVALRTCRAATTTLRAPPQCRSC